MISPANCFPFLVTLTIFALPAALTGCNNVQGIPVIAPHTTITGSADDSALTTKIKAALMASGDMDNFDIRIQTRKDQVALSGFADSQVQLDRKLALVKRIEGVGKIINRVRVRRFT